MGLRSIAAALVFTFAATGSAAAASPAPSAAMTAPIRALLRALNTASAAPIGDAFTTETTIVDEFAPFVWTGPGAGARYLRDFNAMTRSSRITGTKGTLGKVLAFDRSGSVAYVVYAADVSGNTNGKAFLEHGTWTFVLDRSGSGWKIAAVTWGTVHMSP